MIPMRLLGLILAQPRFPLNSTYPGPAGTIILDTLRSDRKGHFAALTLGKPMNLAGREMPEGVLYVDEDELKWRLARKICATALQTKMGRRREMMISAAIVYGLKSRAKHLIVHTTKMNYAQALAQVVPWTRTIIYHHTAEDQNRAPMDVLGVLKGCWAHIFVSDYAESTFLAKARMLGSHKVRSVVVKNKVNCSRFKLDHALREEIRRRLGLAGAQVAVLFSGRMIKRKGLDILLEAITSLPRPVYDKIVLVCMGARDYGDADWAGDYKHYNKLMQFLRNCGKMRVLGYRPPEEVPGVVAACDVLAFPITQPEACGLVVLEAQASGVPVIAPAVGGTAEYFLPGITGWSVAPGDVASLRDALAHMVEEPQERINMGKMGRELMVNDFNADQYSSDLTLAIERLSDL